MAIRGNEVITEYKSDTRDLERGTRRAEQLVDKFVRTTNAQLGKAGQVGGIGGGGFGFGSIAESLKMLPGLGTLAGAVSTVTGAVKDGIQFGFEYNRVLEESRLAFTRLLGSPEQAEKHIQALQRLRKEGIGLAEAGASSRRFQAARFDLEQIPAYIAAVGDAARFTGAEVDAITRALTQMASKGRVSAEEVNQQLAEQGIPAWRYLADAVAEVDKNFAKLTDEQRIAKIQKMAERGLLSGMGGAQAILRGIQKDFGGFSREFAEQTATGIEGQLEAVAARLAGTATGPFFERYKSLLRGVLHVANSETGEALARGAASGSNTLLNGMDAALKLGGDIGSGLMQGAAGKGFDAAKQFVGEFAQGIGAQSPATEFIPLGAYAAQGFRIGFSAEMDKGGGIMGLFQGGRGALSQGVRQHDDLIELAAREVGLDPNLLRAMIQQESGGRAGARSPAGAVGIAQFMPGTARAYGLQVGGGVDERLDPAKAIPAMARHMADLLRQFEGDISKALAGYNAGAGAVNKYGGVPPYRETQNYVKSIRSMYGRMSGGGLASMSVEQQQQLIWQMARQSGVWQTNRYSGGADLTTGMGMFADGFRDVPQGSGLDSLVPAGPVVARLQDELELITNDAVKLTQVFSQPLIPFPGSTEAVEALNEKIRQTVPILQTAQKEASFLGITGKGAGEAFEDAWISATTNVDQSVTQMLRNVPLNFAQTLNQMVQQWAASQISGLLKQLIGWGLGALAGGVAGGLSGGSQASNAAFGSPGGGLTTGGPFLGAPPMRFATGGSFVVGGPGGTDKTPVSFLATKGEQVTVETPAQVRARGVTIINNKTTVINYQPRNVPNSATTRRSNREIFETLLAFAR